jgi:hypothetical protein
MLVRATVGPTSTLSGTAADLLATGFAFFSYLPQSAAVALFQRALRLDFDGVHQFSIPTVTSAPAPIFVADENPFIVVQETIAPTVVGPTHKMVVGAVLTNEAQMATPETAAAIIGRSLSAKAASSLDAVVFDSNAASSSRDAGLLQGLSSEGATAGGGVTAMVGDIAKIADKLAGAGTGANGEEIMWFAGTPAAVKLRALAGPMFTYPVIGTSGLADDMLVGVLPSGIASGYSGLPTIDSDQAVLHMEDVDFADTEMQDVPIPCGLLAQRVTHTEGWVARG